jgi:hypothetical protein
MIVDYVGAVDESLADIERLARIITLRIYHTARLTSHKMSSLLQDRIIMSIHIWSVFCLH